MDGADEIYNAVLVSVDPLAKTTQGMEVIKVMVMPRAVPFLTTAR